MVEEPKQSRTEEILANILAGVPSDVDPQSRVEFLLNEIAESLAGGMTSGKFVGFVSPGDKFPKERLDGKPLQNEDYAKPNQNADFPFTVENIEFTDRFMSALYLKGKWEPFPGAIQTTLETPVEDPELETLSESGEYQSIANKEFKLAIEDLIENKLQQKGLSVAQNEGNLVIYDGQVALTYEELKTMLKESKYWVYLTYKNVIYMPVNFNDSSVLEFHGGFNLNDNSYAAEIMMDQNSVVTYNKQIKNENAKYKYKTLPDWEEDIAELEKPEEYYPNCDTVVTLFKMAGHKVKAIYDPETYILKLQLLDAQNQVISETEEVDLELGDMVVSASYLEDEKSIKFVQNDGSDFLVDISKLIDGLVPDTRKVGTHDLKQDITVDDIKEDIELELYQKIEDETLETEVKTVPGAINELVDKKLNIQQDPDNENKILSIDHYGKIIPKELEISQKPYVELNKNEDYLYDILFNEYDFDLANEYYKSAQLGLFGCSSIKKDNLFIRSFDWGYGDNVAFNIYSEPTGKYKSIGLSGHVKGLTKEVVERKDDNKLYSIVPYATVDGINENGVFAALNVVPNDFGKTTGTNPDGIDICALMIPRFVLDNYDNAEDAVNDLRYKYNIYIPESFNYELHLLIGDKNTSYSVEFIENHIEIAENRNYITNFHVHNTSVDASNKIIYSSVEPHGMGLERFDLISDAYESLTKDNAKDLLQSLAYSNTYKLNTAGVPTWKTEYCSNTETYGNLTVTTDGEAFKDIYADAKAKYDLGERNGSYDISLHSAIYDLDNLSVEFYCEEDFGSAIKNNIKFSTYTKAQIDEQQNAQNEEIEKTNKKFTDKVSEEDKALSESEVNDKINSMSAYPIYKDSEQNNFATKQELDDATVYFNAKGEVRVPTLNDYTYILNDETKDNKLSRYVYDDEQQIWAFQFAVADINLTQEQWDAINSGITAEKLQEILEEQVAQNEAIQDNTDLITEVATILLNQVIPTINNHATKIKNLEDNKQDNLPEVVNDKFLHTTTDGKLEWADGKGGASEWSATTTYKANEQVWVKDAKGKFNYYFSLKADNTGKAPATESEWWSLVSDNTITVSTMPTPTKAIADSGIIYKFNGTTTANYVKGQEYICIADGSNYIWQVIDPIPQYSTMPTASKKLLSLIVKYIGTNTNDYTKDNMYQCVLDGSNYKWVNVSSPKMSGEPTKLELNSNVTLIVSDNYVTCVLQGSHSTATYTNLIPAKYRPLGTIWMSGTSDWTNFSGIVSVNNTGTIQLQSVKSFYGSCSWTIGSDTAVQDLGNGCKLYYGDSNCTLVFDGASSIQDKVLPTKFWPKQTCSCVCSSNWTALAGLVWVNTSGVIQCQNRSGNHYGSISWQYRSATAVDRPPANNMYGGDYSSSTTYTDNKIRFQDGGNGAKANTVSITYISKRQFLFQGSFQCSNASVNNWFTIGYLYYNNTRINYANQFETIGSDGNLNAALIRFTNSYSDFRYIITKTPMSSTLYINTVVNTKFDLY